MEKEKKEIKKYEGMRLSPTSIITYTRCPREFYYHYVKKLPTPPSIHLVKGNLVHHVLENFFKVPFNKDLEGTMEKLFNKELESNKDNLEELNLSKQEIDRSIQECRNMIEMWLNNFRIKIDHLIWAQKAENDRHAYFLLKPKVREKFYKDDELNLCGFVDRVHTDFDGVTTIGDYKTSNRYGIGIKNEYEIQCSLYALLYKRIEGKVPDFTSIIFVRFGEEVRTRVTPSQISMALKLVKETNASTKSDKKEDYPKNECNFCKWCSYMDTCSKLEEFKDEKRQEKAMENIKDELAKKAIEKKD